MVEEITEMDESLKKKKQCKTRNILLVVVLCLAVGFLWHNYYTSSDIKRLGWTMAMLGKTRNDLKKYYDQKSSYPETLTELTQFGKNNPNSGIKSKLPKEYISQKKGCTLEHDSLNGKGGWFYDNATGDIRVNVTVPVKNYFKLYFGEERNQIPSEW
jgi:hypothetical protein